MIDTVRLTFAALRDAGLPASDDLSVLPLETCEQEVLLGLDDIGRPHLLLAAEDEDIPSSGIATLGIDSRTLAVGGHTSRFLEVSCLFESLADVFDYLVVAVVERLAAPPTSPGAVVAAVLEQWKQFLLPAVGPPGRDRLAALFGELVVLLDVVKADPARRVDVWVGPFGARHDLRRGPNAVEVKTTRSHTSHEITIHGEDQLLEPDSGVLHLHLVRLEEAPDAGRSVSSVVDELLAAGAPAEKLFEAMSASGVPPVELPGADEVRFDVRERLTVPVDEATPRIVPASFAGGATPVGVVDFSYRIDLAHVLNRALDRSGYAGVIRSLALGPIS